MIAGGLALLVTSADGQENSASRTPEEQVKALQHEYDAAFQAWIKASREAKTPEEQEAAAKLPGRQPALFGARFMKVARDNPGTTAAEVALIWVGSHVLIDDDAHQARILLARDYSRSGKLAPVLALQSGPGALSEPVETLLRKALADNPHREVQGLAAYWLGRVLKGRAGAARSKDKLDTLPQMQLQGYDRQYGPGWKDLVRRSDPEALDREAEMLFLRTAKEFGDLPHNDKRGKQGPLLRDVASAYLTELQELNVGKKAPDVEGTDLDGKPFRLSDYRGKVVVVEFGSHFFCGRCRDLYPIQKSLAKSFAGQPFALVSIEVGREGDPLRDREALKKARAAEGLTWRCVWDGDWDGPINRAWNVRLFPTVYVVDRDGVIRFKSVSGADLEKVLSGMLSEK
jgi:thiol-disulfide isomerase/thioredoxin